MGIIYQAKNPVNGKRYVGQASGSDGTGDLLAKKQYAYESTSRGDRGNVRPFCRALRKWAARGVAFEWSILTECADDLLDREEIRYIATLGTNANNGGHGYNMDNGGTSDRGSFTTLGDSIRKGRLAMNWSQHEASKKLDVAVTTWSRWECGVAVPPMSEETPTLQRIAELLGTTVSDLTRGV